MVQSGQEKVSPDYLFGSLSCMMFHFVVDAQLQVIQRQALDQSGQGDFAD